MAARVSTAKPGPALEVEERLEDVVLGSKRCSIPTMGH
jgi:hypothetical protein